MADQDEADREAAELLPCLTTCGPTLHAGGCEQSRRAVAAALRERDEKIKKLTADLDEEVRDYYTLEAERDSLRAALMHVPHVHDKRRYGDCETCNHIRAALAQRPKP